MTLGLVLSLAEGAGRHIHHALGMTRKAASPPCTVHRTRPGSVGNESCASSVYMTRLIVWQILKDRVKFQFMTHLWYSKS